MLLNKKIPFIYILNKVKYNLLYVLVLSIVIVYLINHYKFLFPEIPLSIPAFIGTSVSILLSFKLNQSYDRWWEARKVWGSIVNDSRSFVLQLLQFPKKDSEQIVRKMAYRQIAWCYSLGQSLRGLNGAEKIDKYITPEEFNELNNHNSKPLALLQMHIDDLRELREQGKLDPYSHVQLDNTIVRLCEAQGKAERIKSTVFPVTYRIFLHGLIYLFVTTLSIALQDIEGYFEIPILLAISAAFFLLEKSATHMQDPFENRPTDTAMTTIAGKIELNIKQLLKEKNVNVPEQPDNFYIL